MDKGYAYSKEEMAYDYTHQAILGLMWLLWDVDVVTWDSEMVWDIAHDLAVKYRDAGNE